MLGLLFMTKKKKRTLEESVSLIQQGDQLLLNEVIEAYKPFIAKSVSSVCKRYIYETDDEFSIGLIAFNDSIEKYSPERGSSLLSFSEVLIKRRVIDYIRKQSKNQHIRLDLFNSEYEEESSGTVIVNELSIEDYKKKSDEELRIDEISQFQTLLASYDLSFNELIKNSPKHVDARMNAILVAKKLVDNRELKSYLFEKRDFQSKN